MTRQPQVRAVIYGRSSIAKQKSINDQLTENRAACQANDWTVVKELSDPTSASRYATKVRENWARLLELLPEVDVIVLWEPSRGDRSLASWATFLDSSRANKVRIHAVSHARTYNPANARDYRSLAEDGVDAAYESDKKSEQVRRGKAAAARAGRPDGVLTFGYARRYDPVTREFDSQHEQPEHAAIVRDIIGSLAGGEPVSGICRRLNRAGTPTPRGAKWYAASVKAIALNPAYRPHPDNPARGCRVHHGQTYVACWPPLVTETEWQAVQEILGTGDKAVRAQRLASKPGQVRYLLSGAARVMTSQCGGKLLAHKASVARAAGYICEADGCVACPMVEADKYVTKLVVDRVSEPDARDMWVADDTAARQATDELARLRAELKQARASFAMPGGISSEAMAMKEEAMAPAIADAERRSRPTGLSLAALQLFDAAKMGADRVRPTWEAFPLPAQREVIAGMFTSLVLGPVRTRLTRWIPEGDRFAIVSARISHEWRKP